ncbi:MAG: hypothetical protein KC620_10235, partial [Myxococcales bacterium]|nr:hypothetical protein [Myxococcales bacterium]
CANGRCLAACAGECPAGLRCVDFGTGAWCTPLPLAEGAACESVTACAAGLMCTAGRCLPDCEAGCPATTLCAAEACHPRCASAADCRPGRVCAVFDDKGPHCVERGPGALGEPCLIGADCASGACFEGQCRALCQNECPAGARCVALGTTAVCLASGPAEAGAVCAQGDECASGLCLGRRCADPCPEGDACPAGTACRDRLGARRCVGICRLDGPQCSANEACALSPEALEGECQPAAGEVVGLACAADAECAAPAVACLEGADGRRCRAPCALYDGACPDGQACAPLEPDAPVGACVPAGPGAPLAPCAQGADCASGWCVASYLDGRCGRPCASDAHCPSGRCVDLARDPAAPLWVCAPLCADDADCAPPLRCRRDLEGRGACY